MIWIKKQSDRYVTMSSLRFDKIKKGLVGMVQNIINRSRGLKCLIQALFAGSVRKIHTSTENSNCMCSLHKRN